MKVLLGVFLNTKNSFEVSYHGVGVNSLRLTKIP
jgi:hypothetical protein